MAYINRDLSHATYQSFEPIPKGEYQAQIINSEFRKSASGNDMLNFTWEILFGDYRGRKVFDRIMLTGNEKAVEIGDNRLRGMAEATGHPSPNFITDTAELHGRPCTIRIKIEAGKDGYDDQNRITSFAKSESAPAQPLPSQSPPLPPMPPQGYAQPAPYAPPVPPAASPTPPPPTSVSPPQYPPQPANVPPSYAPAPAQSPAVPPVPPPAAAPAAQTQPQPAPAGPQNAPWDEVAF